jgi:hypothetical protein
MLVDGLICKENTDSGRLFPGHNDLEKLNDFISNGILSMDRCSYRDNHFLSNILDSISFVECTRQY